MTTNATPRKTTGGTLAAAGSASGLPVVVRKQLHRAAISAALVGGLLGALSAPASAATDQISGGAFFGTTECGPPPAGYEDFNDYPPLVMTGDLEGCWYTNIETTKVGGGPSGVYLETGEEVFVGTLNDGPEGTFATTYKFESQWTPDFGSELRGRCQHPIAAGSGTGGFDGATGRVDFKDEVTTGRYFYRGHITLG